MSLKRQLFKTIKQVFKYLNKNIVSAIKKQIVWLLRTLFITKRRRGSVNAGFVLPTVVMVSLVVILLTTAILFRSFERAKNASNVRVNEVTMQAATPALERAKAKISELFADPTLPRSVPSNTTFYTTLISKLPVYTLGDETPITLNYDIDANNVIEEPDTLENKENSKAAWKFPADTDNNGKFDSFILYAINFRTPPQVGATQTRKRIPLDARTPPMLPAKAGGACDIAGETSASLVGASGWYKLPTGELKKSFFVYTATVPITSIGSLDSSKYEPYRGNKGFSALEMQQDRSQVPITNNAVVYEDDLDITPGPRFRLNGRVFTNSNLLTGKSDQEIRLFQVSSRYSCYYERENGKIIVGGNVAGSSPISASDLGLVKVDLFQENNTPATATTATTNKSTSNNSNEIAYNSQAYAQRIDLLVNAQLIHTTSTDPQEVEEKRNKRITADPSLDSDKVRREELEIYFKKRTRRVPFKEVPYNDPTKPAIGTYTTANVLQGYNASGRSNGLRPPDSWIYPTDTNTTLTLNTAQLPAKDPDAVATSPVTEANLGDRIIVGNNLPELKWNDTKGIFVGEEEPETVAAGVTWASSTKDRTRTTSVKQLADLGVTGRDGFWEIAAASPRADALDVIGGLRVITGAGVYRRTGSGLPTIASALTVWPDTMPMSVPDPTDPLDASKQKRGDLVMRATAVYHYNSDSYAPNAATADDYQTPIACVSSYYNPTNATTAATSNNGLVYGVPATTSASVTRGQTLTAGLFTTAANADDVANTGVDLLERLKYQANLKFPNGRLVNPLLRQALAKATASKLTLSEQSAIDSTICAINIADGSLARNATVIPDGAIQETTFLDARQIKAIDKGAALTGNYNLEVEQRQPLEIRATVIDLNLLRTTSITGTWANEYLLPNSGIIYASREDAQKDISDSTSENVSASDYRLDPERRPNAVMLINGSNLSRQNNYRAEEKGLILATDLPAYVKGNFNLHTKQEFKGTDLLPAPSDATYDSKFYSRAASNRDRDFACRPSDPRLPNCTTGETWRSASVIADAVTLLSNNFREGFRDEGDYDLRNNQVNDPNAVLNRLKAGFWNNNFVTSSNFFINSGGDAYYTGTPTATDNNSSYLNNFVTPIQRRGDFPEYVMEMCFKIPVSECKTEPGVNDWYIGYDGDRTIQSHNLPIDADPTKLMAGTTAQPAMANFRRFARRVAFKRNSSGQLVNAANVAISITATPIPLGIKSGVVKRLPVVLTGTPSKVDAASLPDVAPNALWFATTSSTSTSPPAFNTGEIKYNFTNTNTSTPGSNFYRLFFRYPQAPDPTALLLSPPNYSSFRDFPGDTTTTPPFTSLSRNEYFQPLLEPVLQLQVTTAAPQDQGYASLAGSLSSVVKNTRWLSKASDTTFNLIIAAGDTPARVGASTYEINGGLHNFVRFLENWDGVNANISGSFIQFKRSIYATAPYQALVRPGAATAATTSSNVNALSTTAINSVFIRTLNTSRPGYTSDSTSVGSTAAGEAPYYMPPNRNWGFDVALLAQNPDLFAQRFVIPATDPPSEYFREVGRDDLWVKTLLCAVQTQTSDGFDTPDTTYFGSGLKFALPATERPGDCKLHP
ncbi:hormogonium polysaccharide biosynthesis protein HpsA [Halotia branconii]|uniref:Hormogonium polysaccharide biosynthesis protein HpsA n=1 Tax=Halotia branconii CENA392 TaxID=1539056 RepID=A0AAJ6NVZ4_9CYAN|nr:hormogonium polysaccharide biosynthesis protein HpsA [Halotia branconii]WGV27760.1 hormogonium polysaccharide biosynthesis protein HpsA [Halotia branconii CENA392]